MRISIHSTSYINYYVIIKRAFPDKAHFSCILHAVGDATKGSGVLPQLREQRDATDGKELPHMAVVVSFTQQQNYVS